MTSPADNTVERLRQLRTKRHAAKGSRLVALGLSAVSTVGLGAFIQHNNAEPTGLSGTADLQSASVATTLPLETAIPTPTGTSSISSSDTTSPTTPSSTRTAVAQTSAIHDGSFTGATYTNRWGAVQVQVTVAGGKITAVDILQSPGGSNKSVSINNRALPTLVQGTLAKQSAQVTNVTGATYTTGSYQQSLQSAIDKAKL